MGKNFSEKSNFQEFITVNNLKKNEVAKILGVSNAFITQIIQGKRDLPKDKLALIKASGFNSEMLAEDVSFLDVASSRTNKAVPFYANLPVSGGSADIALYNDDEEITGYIELPGFWGEGAFMVQGCSMSPEINNGDIISVSERITSLDSLNTERIYFIVTSDGERMIKRVYEDEEDKTKLVCFSPNFKPFRIDKESIIQIRRVVGHIRRL